MKKSTKLYGALLAASLMSVTAFAADSTTTTTGTTTGTTGTGTTTTTKPTALDSTEKCSGGGSRTLSGTWDKTSTGAIDITTTFKACVLRNGDTHNGTASLKGTLLLAKSGDFTVDVASKVDTTIDRKDGSKLARKCTVTKKGSYVNKTHTFDGSITRTGCSLVGQVREHENVAEYLLRDAISDDEDGGSNMDRRLLPKGYDADSNDEKDKNKGKEKDDDDDKKPSTTPPQPATK